MCLVERKREPLVPQRFEASIKGKSCTLRREPGSNDGIAGIHRKVLRRTEMSVWIIMEEDWKSD